MFHPVGSQPSSVYWRRRTMLLSALALVIVLIALTVSTLSGGDGKPAGAGGSPTGPTTSSKPVTHSPSPKHSSSISTSRRRSPSPSGSSSTTPTTTPSAAPATCVLTALRLTAKTGKATYAVGASPLVELQVVNPGPRPCSRDLSDKQIQLRVYNGASRVWGSHDCAVQPGTKVQTLAVGRAYLFQVAWTGLTSSPGCMGTRQRVGAGSYTLYASLSGRSASAAQFQIS